MPVAFALFAAVKKEDLPSQMWIRSFATKYMASRVGHILLALSLPLGFYSSLVILRKKAGYGRKEPLYHFSLRTDLAHIVRCILGPIQRSL